MKRIAVMTSGGDAPGMNAAIRAVVRQATFCQLEVVAIREGLEGLIEGYFEPITSSSVSNIIQRGGTILRTCRSERFRTPTYQQAAYRQLEKASIDAVLLIGGNGSIEGVRKFTTRHPIPFIAIPKTIDNDVAATDYAIGFDTACNTVMEAIDKIRDTADAHHRLFFVEVMGRDHGFIALNAAISSGAEAVLLPEYPNSVEDLLSQLEKGWLRHKSSLIVVVAEGAIKQGLGKLIEAVQARFHHFEIKTSTLGHLQRGGSPSSFDRILASRLGSAAVLGLLDGKKNCTIGLIENKIAFTPFEQQLHREPNPTLLQLVYTLSA